MFMDEMRKLKAVIVKHENRLRAVEAQVVELMAEKKRNEAPRTEDSAEGGDAAQAHLDSDEV